MKNNQGMTLVEVVVVIFILLMLVLLLLPATRSARGPARRTNCINQMKQLCFASLNYESAHGRFPLAMRGTFAPIDQNGPQPGAEQDGYSFLVALLPYSEEPELFDAIVAASDNFQLPLNSSNFRSGDSKSPWDAEVELLICPSFPGENFATGRYGDVERPQVSNYHAMVAACVEGPTQRLCDDDPRLAGVLVTEGSSPDGVPIREIEDGTSRTILLAESRAERWSAWFSGSSVAMSALSPNLVSRGDLATDESGYNAVPAEIASSLNYGRREKAKSRDAMYWPRKRDQRDWGPSSAHEGGVVIHGYSDGHVSSIAPGIDQTTYFRMATRAGGEPLQGEEH